MHRSHIYDRWKVQTTSLRSCAMSPWFGDVLRVSTSQTQRRHVLDLRGFLESPPSAQNPLPQTNTQKRREKKHTKNKNLNNPWMIKSKAKQPPQGEAYWPRNGEYHGKCPCQEVDEVVRSHMALVTPLQWGQPDRQSLCEVARHGVSDLRLEQWV